jgi:hypothetical protein
MRPGTVGLYKLTHSSKPPGFKRFPIEGFPGFKVCFFKFTLYRYSTAGSGGSAGSGGWVSSGGAAAANSELAATVGSAVQLLHAFS